MGGKRPPLDEEKSLWEATVAAEGVTTDAGEGTGLSLVDAGLAGSGANSFVSMMAVIYPGQPTLVDSKDITAFDNDTGEVTVASAFKGGEVAAGVPYKIVTFRFVPAEVAAIEAALDTHETAQATHRTALGTHDTDIKALLATIAGYIDDEVAAIITSQGRMLFPKDFWSAAQATAQITVDPVTVALPSVTPSLPDGVTITRAIAMMKFRKVSNGDAVANHIDFDTAGVGPHDPALQVDKATTGYIDALLLPDTFLRVEGDGIEGGDVWVGDTDIKAKVESGVATTFQLGDDIRCLATTLDLYDIQVGLRIWYSV